MLKKSHLDHMAKLLEGFASGEVAVKHELKSVIDAIGLVSTLAEKEQGVRDTPLGQAISVLAHFKMHLHTTFVTFNPPKELAPLPEDSELLKQLPEDDDD
jgi:hypothetical protein